MSSRVLLCVAGSGLVLVLAACTDFTGLDFARTDLVSIGLTGESVVEVGDTVRVKATGGVSGIIGMFSYDLLPDARWSVSDPSIAQLQTPPPASIDTLFPAQMLVRGIRAGSTQIKATARGLSGDATIRVIPPVSTIQVIPARDTVAVGDTIRLTVGAYDAGGAPIQGLQLVFAVSGGVKFSTSDATSARVVGIAPGQATISARFRRAVGEAALVVIPRAP